VKRVFQLGNLLLAAYLFALPLLIGLHQLHHTTHQDHLHADAETLLHESDCDLCDLYQNQTGLVEVIEGPEILLSPLSIEKITSLEVLRLEDTCPSLRGPPLS